MLRFNLAQTLSPSPQPAKQEPATPSREVKKDKPSRGQHAPKDKGPAALGGVPQVAEHPKVEPGQGGGDARAGGSGAGASGREEEEHTVVTGVQLVPFEGSLANGAVPPLCTLNPGP